MTVPSQQIQPFCKKIRKEIVFPICQQARYFHSITWKSSNPVAIFFWTLLLVFRSVKIYTNSSTTKYIQIIQFYSASQFDHFNLPIYSIYSHTSHSLLLSCFLSFQKNTPSFNSFSMLISLSKKLPLNFNDLLPTIPTQ